jgi:phage-related protein
MALTDTQVFFAGNDLNVVAGATISDHNFNDLPSRELKTFKLARSDKSITTSAEYSSKTATVTLILRGCNRGETETVMRNLKVLLRPINQELKVSQAETDTIYKSATLNGISYTWVSNKAIITLTFIASDPIAYEDDIRTLLNINVTSSTNVTSINNEGSFDAQPIISLSYNSVTSGTSQSLSIRNEETGQGITLNGNFATSDTIEINSADQTIVMNGANIDFSGQFPTFPPGTGAFGYSDTFSGRDVDISVTYVKRDI